MGKLKVLIIDDEIDLVETLKLRLESKGFDVIEAYDGLEGLRKARADVPDLIILDIMLPKFDGYHICRMLKFDEKYKHIPIVMLTARSQESDKKTGLEQGADVYLTKPFDSKVLIEHIDRLTESIKRS